MDFYVAVAPRCSAANRVIRISDRDGHSLAQRARMTRRLVAVLAVLWPGCSDSAPPPDLTMIDACPATECMVGPTIADAQGLVATIDASPTWFGLTPYTTGCLPASADVPITGTVTVRGDAIAVPAECAARTDCRQAVKFVLRDAPAGVECLEPEHIECAAITAQDTTIRMRTVMVDVHPGEYNFIPVVEVLAACATPCGSAELACEASHTCWGNIRDHCAYCLGGSNEECACWTGSELASDGTECTMQVSGDAGFVGTCQAGACTRPSD
jgi:hypothetical protein